jgi:hypothetical protein
MLYKTTIMWKSADSYHLGRRKNIHSKEPSAFLSKCSTCESSTKSYWKEWSPNLRQSSSQVYPRIVSSLLLLISVSSLPEVESGESMVLLFAKIVNSIGPSRVYRGCCITTVGPVQPTNPGKRPDDGILRQEMSSSETHDQEEYHTSFPYTYSSAHPWSCWFSQVSTKTWSEIIISTR